MIRLSEFLDKIVNLTSYAVLIATIAISGCATPNTSITTSGETIICASTEEGGCVAKGCQKDYDCKGERVCKNGACMSRVEAKYATESSSSSPGILSLIGSIFNHTPTGSQIGTTCCDIYGVSRCIIPNGNPIGSNCFCPGQGYGVTCR